MKGRARYKIACKTVENDAFQDLFETISIIIRKKINADGKLVVQKEIKQQIC